MWPRNNDVLSNMYANTSPHPLAAKSFTTRSRFERETLAETQEMITTSPSGHLIFRCRSKLFDPYEACWDQLTPKTWRPDPDSNGRPSRTREMITTSPSSLYLNDLVFAYNILFWPLWSLLFQPQITSKHVTGGQNSLYLVGNVLQYDQTVVCPPLPSVCRREFY